MAFNSISLVSIHHIFMPAWHFSDSHFDLLLIQIAIKLISLFSVGKITSLSISPFWPMCSISSCKLSISPGHFLKLLLETIFKMYGVILLHRKVWSNTGSADSTFWRWDTLSYFALVLYNFSVLLCVQEKRKMQSSKFSCAPPPPYPLLTIYCIFLSYEWGVAN